MCSVFFSGKIWGYFIFRKLLLQHYMKPQHYLFCFFYLFFFRRIIPDEFLPMQNICFVFLKAVIIKRVINDKFFYRKKVWHTSSIYYIDVNAGSIYQLFLNYFKK